MISARKPSKTPEQREDFLFDRIKGERRGSAALRSKKIMLLFIVLSGTAHILRSHDHARAACARPKRDERHWSEVAQL
jgi:hypothetical protein